MRQLLLFPEKNIFGEGDRVRFIWEGNAFGLKGTVRSQISSSSVRVQFDDLQTYHCLPEALEHI